MKTEWKKYRFVDFASFKYGKMPIKSKVLDVGNYPIFSGYGTKGFYDEYNVEKGTLIIVARGVGGTGDVKITHERCYLTNLSISASIDDNISTSEFLYYYFLKRNLRYLDSGSAQSQITISDLEKIEITLPPLPAQKKIAAILSALDAKIENNNAINKNLEAQAQALFKSWFVDFEPFGGVMPEGWRVGKAEEIIEIHDGKRIPLSNMQRAKLKKIYPYYGATCIMDYVDDYLFDGIFLLFAEDGTVITKDGNPVLQYVDGKFWVNNHAHILTGKNDFSTEMLWLVFCKMSINSIVTGAVQPKISQGNLRQLDVIIPTQNILCKFDSLIQPIFKKIRMINQENTRLAALRDALLPKLMSGEIEV